jgi:hypothetical protein
MNESVNPADCGAYILHEPHTYYTGFLGWKKRDCRGTSFDLPEDFEPPSAALVPLHIFEHKHDFKLVKGVQVGPDQFLRKPDADILWECDWLDCKELFVIDRALWQEQGVPYNVYN